MKIIWSFVALILSMMLAVDPAGARDTHNMPKAVVLIGVDGFRWDIPDRFHTPNIDLLIRNGVRAEMIPVWPSLTYPNFWAIATGLYPDHNGIVANEMFDPRMGQSFRDGSFNDSRWWRGEPIWATLEKQGGKAAVLSWPGAEATEGEGRPTYGMSYDPFYARMSLHARVDNVIDLLNRDDDKRPALLTIYTPLVDDAEHAHGIESNETKEAVEQVDAMVGYLVARLKETGAFDTTTIVIVADHGHVDVPAGQTVNVDGLIDLNRLNRVALGSGPTMALWPQAGYVPVLLQGTGAQRDHLRIVAKRDLPKRFHNSASDRVPPFLLVADPGYVLCVRSDLRCNAMKGMHGYDNALPDMHAFFLAAGADIARGATLSPFENIDVYSLLSHLLQVKAAQTDGSIAPFCGVLVSRPEACRPVQ